MHIAVNKDRKELALLFKGVGVEIGVAEARFSKTILNNDKVIKLYGVDPFTPLPGYRDYTKKSTFERMYGNTMKRMQDYLNFELIKKTSMEAVKQFEDGELDFVYIDGDHSYDKVMEDIIAWAPKVKSGGIIAGDDYSRIKDRGDRYDVIRAVDDYVKENNIAELFLYTAGRTPTNWIFIR